MRFLSGAVLTPSEAVFADDVAVQPGAPPRRDEVYAPDVSFYGAWSGVPAGACNAASSLTCASSTCSVLNERGSE
jgi:hypothetical protein